jgi:hypothetical protein
MSIEIVRTLPEKDWRRFVDDQPTGNVFHTPEMYRVFAEAEGHRPTVWAAINNREGPLSLLLPVQVTIWGGLLNRLTTRYIAYGSVLCVPGPLGKEALGLLLQVYKKEMEGRALFSEFRHLFDLSHLQSVLTENSFAYEDHLNYLIDLDRFAEEVLQSIGRRTRKKIRKGLRDGLVQVTEVTERAELDQWYDTLQKTYARAQVLLADRSLFDAAFDILQPKGMAKFIIAKVNGEPAACSLELVYRDTIYGWYGGSDRDYTNHYPSEMLMWHVLEWGANNGFRVYDFGGAGRPDEEYGVRDFKAKFGGELVCYGRNMCVHAPRLLWLSKHGYRLARSWL